MYVPVGQCVEALLLIYLRQRYFEEASVRRQEPSGVINLMTRAIHHTHDVRVLQLNNLFRRGASPGKNVGDLATARSSFFFAILIKLFLKI